MTRSIQEQRVAARRRAPDDQASPEYFNWRMLLRPLEPKREGTMPVGLVLTIVISVLLLAMMLNADSTLRKSRANGDGYRQQVARVIATVSNATGFNIPRRHIDSALGRQTGKTKNIDDLLAEQGAAGPASNGTSTNSQEAGASGPTPSTTPDGTPTVRKPTPEDPLTIWMGGDSIAEAFTVGLEPITASTGVFKPVADYRVSTGLVVPEYFNWPEHFANDVLPQHNPDVMVVMFGANDGQNLSIDGKAIKSYTPEWYEAYAARVGKVMDLLRSPTNDRLVIWVGLPPNGPGSRLNHLDALNFIYWREASKRPWMSYLDTWAYLGGPGPAHGFVGSMATSDGTVKNMYQSDNLHLNVAGANFLSWAVMDHLATLVDLSASKSPAERSADAPPAGVVERTELPKPADVP